MNEQTHTTHATEGSRRGEFTEPHGTVVDIPEAEEIIPVSIEASPYHAFKQPMVAPAELFVKKHDLGLFHFHKVPPNTALVISGPTGTRVVTGRSTIVFPTEIANEIHLEIMAVQVFESDIRTKSIYPVDIEGVVYFKVMDGEDSIKKAAQSLLSRTNREVADMIQHIISAHIREICATLSVDDLQNEMAEFNERVVEMAKPKFESLGFAIKIFALSRIVDREGYFRARAAETEAQLVIRRAVAQMEAAVRSADAREQAERRKAEVETFLQRVWKYPAIEKYRSEQAIERERAAREMVAPVVTEGLKIEQAERQKRVTQLQAEAEAIKILELARAKANSNRMIGEVDTAIKTAMTRIFQGLDHGSLGLYLADRLPAILREIATAVKNFDVKWAHVGGQTATSDPIGRTIQSILLSMIPVFQVLGVDLTDWVNERKPGEKLETMLQEFWSNMAPEKQQAILERILSKLDKDLLKELLQKMGS